MRKFWIIAASALMLATPLSPVFAAPQHNVVFNKTAPDVDYSRLPPQAKFLEHVHHLPLYEKPIPLSSLSDGAKGAPLSQYCIALPENGKGMKVSGKIVQEFGIHEEGEDTGPGHRVTEIKFDKHFCLDLLEVYYVRNNPKMPWAPLESKWVGKHVTLIGTFDNGESPAISVDRVIPD
jgi:hypothetical protein